jgi:hypothetical protein
VIAAARMALCGCTFRRTRPIQRREGKLASSLRFSSFSIESSVLGTLKNGCLADIAANGSRSVFATPGSILGASGSVGLSLFMWVIGAIIAAAGMKVYIIWGSVSPYLVPHPKPSHRSVGPTKERRREELSRVPFQKAQVPDHFSLRCQWCAARMGSRELSRLW